MDKIHYLKILPEYFEAVRNGIKTFEIRKDDRGYKLHEQLVLREWDGYRYSGRELCARIDYILNDTAPGIRKGYKVLGISLSESNTARTNGDQIRDIVRRSSDKQLAMQYLKLIPSEAFCEMIRTDKYINECPKHKYIDDMSPCQRCILEWLVQEADNGEEL